MYMAHHWGAADSGHGKITLVVAYWTILDFLRASWEIQADDDAEPIFSEGALEVLSEK